MERRNPVLCLVLLPVFYSLGAFPEINLRKRPVFGLSRFSEVEMGGASLTVQNCTLRASVDDFLDGAEGPQLPAADGGILRPVVVAGQVDVVPLERR